MPFNRIQLNNEEFVLLRAIIFSQFALGDLSRHGRQLLLTEAEKYSDILMKLLQVFYLFLNKFLKNLGDVVF